MTNRPHLLTTTFLASAPDGVHNDGGALDGCALEIHVRNGGKSKRAYLRYNGTPFGEPRTTRLALGSYDLGLHELRRKRVAYEQLIEEGKSPKRHLTLVQEQQAAGTMTFWQAVAEFFEFGHRMLWKSPWNGDPPTTVRSRTISGKP